MKTKGFCISLNSVVGTYGKYLDDLYNLFEILCWQEAEEQEHISLESPSKKNDCKKELILEIHNKRNLSSSPGHFYFNNEVVSVLEYTCRNLWHSIYITHCKTCNSPQYTGNTLFLLKIQGKTYIKSMCANYKNEQSAKDGHGLYCLWMYSAIHLNTWT